MRNHFVSVERALSYTKLPQEPPTELPADAGLLEQRWPHSGAVRFAAVAMAYRPGLPLVLEHVSFALAGGVKAAVVGRSGAGKSSLTVALLRLVPLAAGAISIDGVDIASVGPATLSSPGCNRMRPPCIHTPRPHEPTPHSVSRLARF